MQVETISLVEPVIVLEVLPDGRRNWEIGPKAGIPVRDETRGEPQSEAKGAVGGLPVDVRLDNFRVRSATFVYKDATRGLEERLEAVDADLSAETLSGPFQVSGQATLRGVRTGLDLAVGRLPESGATPLRVGITLPSAEASARFSGSVSYHADVLAVRGKVRAEGEDLASVIATLAAIAPSTTSPQLAVPFSMDTDISGDGDMLKAEDISLRLGENSARGEAQVRFGETPEVLLSVAVPRLDLDPLLQAPQAGGGQAGAKLARPGTGQDAPVVFALPTALTGQLDFGVEALIYRGRVVRQVALAARLADGQISFDQLAAILPGGSALSVTGSLTSEASGPRFAGLIEAASSNLRSELAWLGFDLEALPADRLRRMNLRSGVTATAGQIDFNDLDLKIDLSHVRGGFVIALRERPAFGVGIAVDKVDLDAYLPGVALGGKATTLARPEGRAAERRPAASENAAFIDRFDANLNLQIGELVFQDTEFTDLGMVGTLQQGNLALTEARIGDIAGTRIQASGNIETLAKDATADLKVDASIGDPPGLAKVLGMEPSGFAKIGPSQISGSLKGKVDQLDFNVALNTLGGTLGIYGSVQPLAAPARFDVSAQAQHQNLSFLVSKFVDDWPERRDLGDVDVSAKVSGTPAAVQISGLAGRIGPTEVEGKIAAEFAGPRPKITADLATGVLPLGAFLAAAPGPTPATTATRKDGRANGRRTLRWSKAPLDLSGFRDLDVVMALKSEALVLDKLRLDNAEVAGSLDDGLLEVERLTGVFANGAVQVIGKADLREDIEIGASVVAIEVQSGDLLAKFAGVDRVSGPVTLNADLNTRGRSESDLVSTLNGNGTVNGTLQISAGQEERAGAQLLSILGQKVKQIQGFADATTLLIDAFADDPASLSGAFTVTDGVARTSDTVLEGRGAVARLKGSVDLPAWVMNLDTRVTRTEAPNEAYLTLDLRGPVDAPNVRVGGQLFQRRKPSEPAAPAPQQEPEKIRPENFIEGILKGLQQGN